MLGGTAYQPTQPTTPTTDTTKTTSDDVVIEYKGTTLKNQTVDGNVTIAKSVGNGDVTLRNVTIKGDLIVKGGGSNTVTLEDVDVRGKVRLLKEGVHLHLDGDTDIRKLQIDLAAHITQSSSYKDEIDEIILAGDGDLNKTTRIDVPAKQLRIENQADLILGGDVEKLIVDEDAKGAEIKIKKYTTVKELNTDAKIKLTGGGRIDLLDVSASGVTFDKNLNIRKTDTSNGATAPKENGSTSTGGNSGGSSGGSSGTASKEITGTQEVTLNVPYGEKTADQALAAIPKNVTLNLKGGSTTTTKSTDWKWADGVNYDERPQVDTPYKATTTVKIPDGYTYNGTLNGTLTANATVTVKALDKTAFDKALKDAEAKLAEFVDLTTESDVAAKATKTDKIYIVPDETDASAITKGVKFVLQKDAIAYETLKATISNAKQGVDAGGAKKFDSQKECDEMTAKLKADMDAVDKMTKQTGTNTTTDAFIMNEAKKILDGWKTQPDYAYNPEIWPLKPVESIGYAKRLPYSAPWIDELQYAVHFEWSVDNDALVTLDQQESGSDYYVMVKDNVTEPTTVTFTVDVYYDIRKVGTLGENGEYTATIGAPISATLPSGAPQFKAISDGTPSSTGATKFTGVVPITLNGANAITSVPNNCVTMANSNTESNAGEVSFRTITVDKVEKSGDVLNVTVSVTTGVIGGVWSENSPYPFKKGTLPNISINTSGFVLKTQEEGNPGWYLPTDNTLKLGDDMTVDVLTPAFTGVDLANDPTGPTFTIQTQNMPENAKVEVALATTNVTTDIDNATIKNDATRGSDGKYSVTFNKSDFEAGAKYYLWFRYGSPGSDWAYENRTNRPIYTFNNTTGGNTGSESEGGGSTTEGN